MLAVSAPHHRAVSAPAFSLLRDSIQRAHHLPCASRCGSPTRPETQRRLAVRAAIASPGREDLLSTGSSLAAFPLMLPRSAPESATEFRWSAPIQPPLCALAFRRPSSVHRTSPCDCYRKHPSASEYTPPARASAAQGKACHSSVPADRRWFAQCAAPARTHVADLSPAASSAPSMPEFPAIHRSFRPSKLLLWQTNREEHTQPPMGMQYDAILSFVAFHLLRWRLNSSSC